MPLPRQGTGEAGDRYYLTLQRTMDALQPKVRPMPGALIWLGLVPLMGMIWYMIFVLMLSHALKKELARRALPGDGAWRQTLGTVALLCCSASRCHSLHCYS